MSNDKVLANESASRKGAVLVLQHQGERSPLLALPGSIEIRTSRSARKRDPRSSATSLSRSSPLSSSPTERRRTALSSSRSSAVSWSSIPLPRLCVCVCVCVCVCLRAGWVCELRGSRVSSLLSFFLRLARCCRHRHRRRCCRRRHHRRHRRHRVRRCSSSTLRTT